MTLRASSRSVRVALFLGAGLAVGAFLGGCDDDRASTRAVREASLKLASLTPDGQEPPAASVRSRVYEDVIRRVADVRGAGKDAPGSAEASLLTAKAHAGLAAVAGENLARMENAALFRVNNVRSLLGLWKDQNAQAAAAAYDPKPELDKIDAAMAQAVQAIGEQTNRKATVNARMAGIRAQAQQILDQVKTKREEEAKLRQQTLAVSAAEALRLTEAARGISRTADALEGQAAMLEAQADQIAPQLTEVQSVINQLTRSRELLTAQRQVVVKRAETMAAQADRAKQAAQETAGEIDRLMGQLSALRNGPLTDELKQSLGAETEIAKAIEEARGQLERALGAARTAAAGNVSQGSLELGRIQQHLGELHWTRSRGLGHFASLLTDLGSVEPRLPLADSYAASSETTGKDQAAALEEASKAFEEAIGSLERAGKNDQRTSGALSKLPVARGLDTSAGQHLSRARVSLAEALYASSAGAIDKRAEVRPQQPETPAGEDGAGASAGGGAVDPNSPAGTLKALVERVKAGRFAGMEQSIDAGDPQMNSVIGQLATMLDAAVAFDGAVRQKFGKGYLDLAMEEAANDPAALQQLAAAGMSPEMVQAGLASLQAELESFDPTALTVDMQGDVAKVRLPGTDETAEPLTLKRAGERWVIDLSPQLEPMKMMAGEDFGKYMELAGFALPKLTQAIRDLTRDVAGFDSPKTLETAIQLGMGPLTFEIFGKMQELGIQVPGVGGPGGG